MASRTQSLLSACVIACALALGAAPAAAMDKQQAAAVAQQQTGGRVLAVEQGDHNGDPVFLVRVLTPSGDVRVVVIDARTGAMR
ncbi:MAG: PepSY domain-containing protein [Rhodocyclaceae bacterium]